VSNTDYRTRALSEYGEECHVCGVSECIEVHHLDGDRSNNDIENLVPLCETHHQAVHNGESEVSELAEQLPDETREVKTKVSVSLDGETYQYLDQWAKQHNTSFSGAVREHVDRAREDDVERDPSLLEQRVDLLEDEVEFLRTVVRSAVD
jgi:predicted restriction endonuclease